MSNEQVKEEEIHPTLKTSAALYDIGFRPFNPVGVLSHADGRVAAVGPDGQHQVFERLSDALRWLEAFTAGVEAVSKALEPVDTATLG